LKSDFNITIDDDNIRHEVIKRVTIEVPGRGVFIVDRHHRFVASQMTGVSVPINVVAGQGPIGFPDWSWVEIIIGR